MFDAREKEQIFDEIMDLWPAKTRLTDKELSNWFYSLKGYSAKTVIAALNLAKREREQVSRPPIPAVKRYCKEIEKKQGEKKGAICPWCEGRWMLKVRVYTARAIVSEGMNIPPRFYRPAPKNVSVFVFVPRIAKAHGFSSSVINVYCGRCPPRIGAISFGELERCYKGLYAFADHTSKGVAERLKCDQPPPPSERRPFHWWRESWERGEFSLTLEEEEYLKDRSSLVKTIDEATPKKCLRNAQGCSRTS
jgi:hypothetical protein